MITREDLRVAELANRFAANSEDGSLDAFRQANRQFEVFGDRGYFAVEVWHAPDTGEGAEPEASKGSWGEWRLWAEGVNLCAFRIKLNRVTAVAQETQWFLAPLFRWLIQNWMPLLHENRLPAGGRVVEHQPLSARDAYLDMLESAGDDPDRFHVWQVWAERHALQTAAEGGILPDVFFQRVKNQIEISWGDRMQPGADAVAFLAPDGIARISADRVADALYSAIEWFSKIPELQELTWHKTLSREWDGIKSQSAGLAALSWYLDCSSEPGALTNAFLSALEKLRRSFEDSQNLPMSGRKKCWLGAFSPAVAVFGDLAPGGISDDAAAAVLAECFSAQLNRDISDKPTEDISSHCVWATSTPRDSEYWLALTVLDEIEPDDGSTSLRLDDLLQSISVAVKDVKLGRRGPRGAAFAGKGLIPTILVNTDNPANRHWGRRCTVAHELCHILFDNTKARMFVFDGTSTWGSYSVEQRAIAFVLLLLMPSSPGRLSAAQRDRDVKHANKLMADHLRVSRANLKRHLSNIDEISPHELEFVLGTKSQEI